MTVTDSNSTDTQRWEDVGSNITDTSVSRPGTTSGSYTYHVQSSDAYGTASYGVTSAAVTINTGYGFAPSLTPKLTVPATNSTGSQVISWTAASRH